NRHRNIQTAEKAESRIGCELVHLQIKTAIGDDKRTTTGRGRAATARGAADLQWNLLQRNRVDLIEFQELVGECKVELVSAYSWWRLTENRAQLLLASKPGRTKCI